MPLERTGRCPPCAMVRLLLPAARLILARVGTPARATGLRRQRALPGG